MLNKKVIEIKRRIDLYCKKVCKGHDVIEVSLIKDIIDEVLGGS